jgi:hypothetical protein
MQVTPISTSSVAETGFTLAQTLDNHIETASVSSSERLRAKTQKEVRMRNKYVLYLSFFLLNENMNASELIE